MDDANAMYHQISSLKKIFGRVKRNESCPKVWLFASLQNISKVQQYRDDLNTHIIKPMLRP